MPYNTRVNWVRVPAEHRFEKAAQKKKKKEEKKERPGNQRRSVRSSAALVDSVKCVLVSLQTALFSAQSGGKNVCWKHF